MLSENMVLQSAGSLSVAILALLMVILQILFFTRKPHLTWFAWSAALSFSALIYSLSIFLEYNTLQGPLNRFSGLLEWTAIICLIHCLYGLTFSYLGIETKLYHVIAGVCHSLILILLWFTDYVVADKFIARNFIGLKSPFIEPALGPLGSVFELYIAIAAVNAMIMWLKCKRTDSKYRGIFLAGIGFWILLGIHDGLASLGVPTFQYVMEYGFLGFAIAILWVVFNSYLEIEAEEKYRVITESANDCILVIQDGKIVYENPACYDLLGRSLTDSGGRDFLYIMGSEDRKAVLERYRTLLEGGHVTNPHMVRIRRGSEEQRFVEIASNLVKYKNRPAILSIMRDMTERKHAEEALRKSEKRYRELVDFLPIPLFETDLQGNIISVNPATYEAFGYTEDDLEKGLDLFHMSSTEDRDRIRANIQRILSGKRKDGIEYKGLRKDGTTFPEIMFSSRILYDNKPVGLRGAIIDLTAQKKIEDSLKKISTSLAEAQRIAHIGNWEWNIGSDELYFSDEIYRILGGKPQAFEGGTFESYSEVIYPDDRETVLNAVQRAIDKGAKSEFEHRITRLNGSIREIRQLVEHIPDDTGRTIRVIGIVQDVTEKNQADRELQNTRDHLFQSEKLVSLGRLSAGVAHEILNPVNIISMELQILRTMKDLSPEIREELEVCMEQIDRIVVIAENLKQFSHIPSKKREMTIANINDIIGYVLKLYSSQLKIEEIETEVQYQSDLPEILIDRERIEQVIANLISNAMFFMEGMDNKVLRITTKRELSVGGHNKLKIIVADTGTGIKGEHMSEIFYPFFTTKEQGKGTGLGLSISFGIIQEHRGKIWAENNEWGGASFYIELPENPDISPSAEKNL